ncbi:single-stranded DNA-binding protein [Candidatus Saccharibacteria bacterium]|nr:single-stranded DNA-binding protein [Candidatus Saccharibacteria bacterium]MBR3386401.1 single-stranded DNA-binding protein [Candidatus Saccharibacteria bacterium]
MRGFSKAIITGNLTRDPELRSTTGGTSVCSFSVAVNRVYRGADGENKEEVSFIDCSAWGKLGEMIAQYGKKGSGVLVSGRLSQRSWEDKNGGGKRSRTEIVVEDFNFVGGNGGNGGNSSSSSSYSAPASSSDVASDVPDDIPDEIDLSDVPF